MTGPLTLDFLESTVASASAHGGGWVQIVFHMVCRTSTADYNQCMATDGPVELSVFTEFVDWLASRAPPGTEVRTVDAVIGRE